MSKHLGDYDASTVIYGKFTTYRPSTGAAFTLGGTPALSVYKDNGTTQSTSGVTLTADFDGVTGLNHFAVDTSADGAFYAAGSFFDVVITTGTVDGVSVVGAVVASFTIRKDSALKPTTAGRTLDVSSGGEAGVDWANVGSPTTSLNLSGTTISTSQAVASVSGAVGSVTGNVGGNVTGSVGSVASGGITSASFGSGAITAAAIAADAIGASELAADAVAEIADAVWDEARSGHVAAGSFGEYVPANATHWGGTAVGSATVRADLINVAGSAVSASAGLLNANVTQISGDAAAADALEAILDGTGAALTLKGADASGATPATAGLTVTGGAASTTSGGAAAAAILATGGAGAASTNGAAGGARFVAGGTTTVSGAEGLYVLGTGAGAGLRAVGGSTGNGAHFSGGASGGNGLRLFGAAAHALHCEVDNNDLHGAYFQGQRDGHGICAVGGNGDGSGAGDGINATSSGTGAGLRAESLVVTNAISAATNSIPWNSSWDAEVESECNDALVAQNLDHLVRSAVDTNFATTVHLDSVIGHLADAGTTATFDRTTDALEVLAGASAPSAATIADAVWDEALSGHLGAGSTGASLNAAGSAGDPWTTTLPGSYTGSQAGKMLADILTDTGTTLQAEVDDIQSRLPAALVSGRIDASVGAMAANTLTASALATDAVSEIQSGLSTYAGGDTAGTTTLLSRLTSTRAGYLDNLSGGAVATSAAVAALNNLSAAQVNAEVDAALADVGLTVTVTGRIDAAVSSRLASASYTAPLDAAGVRAAVGLASANLDTQLSTIDTVVDAILDDTGTSGVVVASGSKTGYSLATAPPTATEVADAVLSRNVSNVESSAGEHTLCTLVLMSLESSISGGTLTVRRTNGSTTHVTKTVTTDAAAAPVTGIS